MPKQKLSKSHKRYHKWIIENFGCQVPSCSERNQVQFHHVYQRGKMNKAGGPQPKSGGKKNHWQGVGLCFYHHSYFHDQLTDFDKYEKQFDLDQVSKAKENKEHYQIYFGKTL